MSTAASHHDADRQAGSQRCNASRQPFGVRLCVECKVSFGAIREGQRFCCQRCRFAAWDRLHPRQRPPLLLIAEQPETPGSRRNRGKAIAASNHAPDLELARERGRKRP